MVEVVERDPVSGFPKPQAETLRIAREVQASGVAVSLNCLMTQEGEWYGCQANYDLDGTFVGITMWPVPEPYVVTHIYTQEK